MKVVFIGATGMGLRCLQGIRGLSAIEVVGVVTAPRNVPISYRRDGLVNVLHADFAAFCEAAGIPCAVMQRGMSDARLWERVRSWQPDAFVVVGWHHLLPARWRAVAPAFGLHGSLLPAYRGGAPLVWAIINGEKETGITLFQMDDGVDSGPIVGQAVTAIHDDDTIATLYGRIEQLGLSLLVRWLPAIASATAPLMPQDETRARSCPQRTPEDGRIDWRRTARELYDFIRAQTRPYPGAFTTWSEQRLTIWRARRVDSACASNAAGGTVLSTDRRTLVCTGDGVLELVDVTLGDRDLAGGDLAAAMRAGSVLGC